MTDIMSQTRQQQLESKIDPKADDLLVDQYIVRNPNGQGPDEAATIWGVSVWALIGHMREPENTIARTAADYDLPEVAVRAALAYYRENRALIDARLLVNDAAFE
jgi:uncharacterized protein (DUF433 family)